MAAWDRERESDALDAWVSATARVVVESLRRLVDDDVSDDMRAEATRREYLATAAHVADALDADDDHDALTNELAADRCRMLASALDAAADTLAAEDAE